VRLLYAGVAIFVVLAWLTADSVWRAWNERAGRARAGAVFDLVQQRMPSRPTEAPGAMAWLRDQLTAYRVRLPEPAGSSYARLAADGESAPPELQRVVAIMRSLTAASPPAQPAVRLESAGDRGASRRAVSVLNASGSTLVVTRRRALEDEPASNRFVQRFAALLGAARDDIDRALTSGARPVRLYAVAEDGTLLSLPWPSDTEPADEIARLEAVQLAARPKLPSFAPEEFFFTFDTAEQDVLRYSGFYLDLGGRGLVSTLTMPLDDDGQNGVLALDISHAIDWNGFAAAIEAPVAAAAVMVSGDAPPTWPALRQALGPGAPADLRDALDKVVAAGGTAGDVFPIAHAVVENVGAVAAFQVSHTTWLLTFFPRSTPPFPGGAVALLAGVLVLLLTGFEVNRRKAEREADNAARALQEKQNLLNTMQVPLMVVDPNTDAIVSANQIAESIGIRRGTRFIDRISSDPRARAHYERTQVATSEPRRAYGVPIRVDTGEGPAAERFALVRSVAVTAPIEALEADERHRLGILFLVEPSSDLALIVEDVDQDARRDERRRLAGLLSHGLDTLVQVLQRTMAAGPAASPVLGTWLAEYLERRIHVTGWLLDHWDQEPPTHDSVVDAAQAAETLASLERVFGEARNDAELRARLDWANGPLSTQNGAPSFDVTLDWPADYQMTLPVRGGLGFFLTEALSNAMRHGAPGSVPRVVAQCDRVRKELEFIVENARRGELPGSRSSYGGLAILDGMARLFGWREFAASPQGGRFVVSWRAPLTRRDQPGQPD
jgi:hypothetical protein